MVDQQRAKATTILVVEADRLLALDLQRTLCELGYDVPLAVDSADDALDAAKIFLPHVVVMGLRIRGSSDGIETALKLRACLKFGLLYISGGPDDDQRQRVLAGTPDAEWLLKPFTRIQLSAVVERALLNRNGR